MVEQVASSGMDWCATRGREFGSSKACAWREGSRQQLAKLLCLTLALEHGWLLVKASMLVRSNRKLREHAHTSGAPSLIDYFIPDAVLPKLLFARFPQYIGSTLAPARHPP